MAYLIGTNNMCALMIAILQTIRDLAPRYRFRTVKYRIIRIGVQYNGIIYLYNFASPTGESNVGCVQGKYQKN